MLESVVADLVRAPGVEVSVVLHPDQRLLSTRDVTVFRTTGDGRETLAQAARKADQVLLIAPEIDGTLTSLAQSVVGSGSRLLAGDLGNIRLFSDKKATAGALKSWSAPTFRINEIPVSVDPIVVKPADGVGTLHTAVCRRAKLEETVASIRQQGYMGELIAQPFWRGMPVSFGMFRRSGREPIVLPGCRQFIGWADKQSQRISMRSIAAEPRWLAYRGGRTPLPCVFNWRLHAMAERIDEISLGDGYLGVDMILGPSSDGSHDRVLDVNPRITTTYVAYRRMFPFLGELLLGGAIEPDIHYAGGCRFRFSTDGGVRKQWWGGQRRPAQSDACAPLTRFRGPRVNAEHRISVPHVVSPQASPAPADSSVTATPPVAAHASEPQGQGE